jgi:hypothetical protein
MCYYNLGIGLLVNGSPTVEFPMARGLRQGDPLGPFLFLLAAKGFHAMMESMITNNIFSGYKAGRERSLSIYHL